MLVLSRKANEEIYIGDRISIKVLGIQGNRVRLGIACPADIRIVRAELTSGVSTMACLSRQRIGQSLSACLVG